MINLLGNILTESQALQLLKSNLTPKYFLVQFRRIGKSIPEKVHHVAPPLPSDNLVLLTQTQTIELASDARNSVSFSKLQLLINDYNPDLEVSHID